VAPTPTTIGALLDRYDGLLIDAYGVLVDARGLLPGAAALLAELARRKKPFAIVTNDASRLPATYVARFAGLGVAIDPERIVTSGSLVPGYFRDRGLVGARTCVLGTADSVAYVREGGGVPIALAPGMELDALAVCDDSGTPFVDGIELAFSAVVRAVTAGRIPALVLPNPDLIYPKGDGEYGFTAGAMALLIETALSRRFPALGLRFEHLGKPAPHLFAEAQRRLAETERSPEDRAKPEAPDERSEGSAERDERGGRMKSGRLGTTRVVMIGDQLETDIAGARAAGIDAALLAGVSRWDPSRTDGEPMEPTPRIIDPRGPASEQDTPGIAPTYLLATIEP
jgi:ribonucleotide monophosphatase NagD (HAD superfamily)